MTDDLGTLAATYFRAWKAKDFATLRTLLADDVTFRGPLGNADSGDECVNGLKRMSTILTDVVIHKIFVDDADTLTWFDLHTTNAPPAPTASWSHFEDSKISSIRVTFDARGSARPAADRSRTAPRAYHPHTLRREQLQAVQAPLKQRYRDAPADATVVMRAEGELDSMAVSCSVQTGRALVEAGLHPASGGDGSLACSGDMLLQALVACAGVTLRSVAVNRGIELTGGRIVAEGELDFRGTMAVDRETPVGFRNIQLRFELDPPLSDEDVATLMKLTERYCVVYQTLARGVPVELSHAST